MTQTKNTQTAATTTGATTGQVVEQIRQTTAQTGSLSSLLRKASAVPEIQNSVLLWADVANTAREGGMTVREWAKVTGASANSMTRLCRTYALVSAYVKVGAHADPSKCLTFASAADTTDAVMAETLKSIRGRKADPVGARAERSTKAKSDAVRKSNATRKGSPNKGTSGTSITPATYVDAVNLMTVNVAKVPAKSRAALVEAATALILALDALDADAKVA